MCECKECPDSVLAKLALETAIPPARSGALVPRAWVSSRAPGVLSGPLRDPAAGQHSGRAAHLVCDGGGRGVSSWGPREPHGCGSPHLREARGRLVRARSPRRPSQARWRWGPGTRPVGSRGLGGRGLGAGIMVMSRSCHSHSDRNSVCFSPWLTPAYSETPCRTVRVAGTILTPGNNGVLPSLQGLGDEIHHFSPRCGIARGHSSRVRPRGQPGTAGIRQ